MVSPGELVPILGTYLLLAVFLSLTAHVAARNVLGDVPVPRALLVGPAPALAPFLLQRYHPLLVVAAGVTADLVAVHLVYRLRWRTAGYVTFVHVVVSVILAAVAGALALLLSTAPG